MQISHLKYNKLNLFIR